MTSLFVVGLVLACLAGAMAFLIAYDENSRQFTNRGEARRRALGTAVGAFVFFGVLAGVLVLVVPHVVHP